MLLSCIEDIALDPKNTRSFGTNSFRIVEFSPHSNRADEQMLGSDQLVVDSIPQGIGRT